jgi:hypothetical protein
MGVKKKSVNEYYVATNIMPTQKTNPSPIVEEEALLLKTNMPRREHKPWSSISIRPEANNVSVGEGQQQFNRLIDLGKRCRQNEHKYLLSWQCY